MTQVIIQDEVPRTQIIATAGQTVFNTLWTADAATDVLVYARASGVPAWDAAQLVSSANYTIDFIGASQTVRVTFVAPRVAGDIITIVRDTPAERTNLYINTNFTPSMLNQDFGILTLVDQQDGMYDTIVNPGYNVSAIIDQKDRVLPTLIANQIWAMDPTNTSFIAYNVPASGGVAPANATYILQTPSGDLANSQSLSSLATGIMVSTNSTGVILSRVLAGTANQLGITNPTGISGNPTYFIVDNATLPGVEGIGMPSGTTAQRPVAPVGTNLRFNTSLVSFEFWDGSSWVQVEDSNDIVLLIARLAAHTPGDGASMIGLQDQGTVLNKTVQEMAQVDFVTLTNSTGTLVNGIILGDVALLLAGGTMAGNINMGGNNISNVGDLTVGNLNFNGNTISSTNTNADIQIEPDGTGVTFFTSDVHIENTINSSVVLWSPDLLRTSYTLIEDYSPNFFDLTKISASGSSLMALNPWALDGISSSEVSFFLSTNTSGEVRFNIYKGNNTSTINHTFRGIGDTNLCLDNGNLTIGNGTTTTITINGSSPISSILNDGTMAANSATALATQQSIKTYVDTKDAGNVKSVSGTANRITSTGGANPVVDIAATYAGQSSIVTLGTVSTGTWNGTTISPIFGGTGQSTYTLGDILYSSAANTLAKLPGNTSSEIKYLTQTGTGAVSASPVWSTLSGSDIPGAALTKVDDTNVTLSLGGTPATALLRAASLTLGWTGQLGLTRGGTGASLTASNGGIVYSNATSLAILAGTATARQMLQSGASTTPAWSTATYPATTTINQILYSSAANAITGLATANSSVLVTTSAGVPVMAGTMTNGQLIIGSTGGIPTRGTLSAGPGISISNGAGTITISGTGSGIGWTEVTGTTQAIVADNGYVANNAGLITFTLPVTAAFGTVVNIVGKGAGGMKLNQNAGQNIQVGSVSSTVGVGGSVASTNRYDSIELLCTTANTTWTVLGGPQGNLTIV